MEQPDLPEGGRRIYTVAEITRLIKACLAERFFAVWVTGEISNLRTPQSGHCYFTLKADAAQLSCVMFRGPAAAMRFRLEDGLEVTALGDIDVYEPRGVYQLVVRAIEPRGIGALQIAFEQLKRKLAAEGLFDPANKKPLPFLPARIAIVTSPTGAAIQDMLRMITTRFPPTRVIIYPVRVQGKGAPEEIADAVKELNRLKLADVIIVGRGGGSLEDLWAFNEEVLARSIYESRIPVVSAVGHEIDFTISDMVADVRALTPTQAGELVVPRLEELLETLESAKVGLARGLRRRVELAHARLDAITASSAFRRPKEFIETSAQMLDDVWTSTGEALARMVEDKKTAAVRLAERLENLSPLAVLRRGYSVTLRLPEGKPLTDARNVHPRDVVKTILARGNFTAAVNEVEEGAESGRAGI